MVAQQHEDFVKAAATAIMNIDAIPDMDFNENVSKLKLGVNVSDVKSVGNVDDDSGISII